MKKIISSVKDIVFAYFIQYIMIVFLIGIYIMNFNKDAINNVELIYRYMIIGLTITTIPLTIYLYKKNYRKESKINYKNLVLMIPLGISISLFYNMLTINYVSSKEVMDLNVIILILYTAFLGPIFEEILFRYTALYKAKKYFKESVAVILITIIFALLHTGIINILYAFLIGLVLSIMYKKYNNIIYPIIIHISANFTSIFIKEYSLVCLIISVIMLITSILIIKKQKQ